MPNDMVEAALADIAARYRVPARLGAPVEFEGTAGRVVGAEQMRVLALLAGETEPDLFHPTWHLRWPTTDPKIPGLAPAPAPMFVAGLSESQWSGV